MTFLIAVLVMTFLVGIGSVSFYREERMQREVNFAKDRKPSRRY
jgi:CHASE3 domain sensor protein